MSDESHNNFSMRDNILFFVSYTITSYIFFVECKFKAKINAYSLHHSKWCTELYNVGVMSDYHNNFSMRDNILFFCIRTIISFFL